MYGTPSRMLIALSHMYFEYLHSTQMNRVARGRFGLFALEQTIGRRLS